MEVDTAAPYKFRFPLYCEVNVADQTTGITYAVEERKKAKLMEVLFHDNLQTLTNPPLIPARKQNQSPISLSSLVSALDLAAQSTRTLSSSDETLAALRSAHDLIGSFLSQVKCETDEAPDDDEPMQDRRDDDEIEGSESKIIEEVEEGIREYVLQGKRRKRQVSPSFPAGRAADRGEELSTLDPMDRRRSAIDLVFQFHA